MSKKALIKNPIYGIPVIIVLISSFYLYDNYQVKKEMNEYPLLETYKEEVKGYVTKIEFSYIYTNTYRINLTDNSQFSISDLGWIRLQDYIYRPYNTDSIYVYRNDSLIFNGKFN